MHLCQRLADKKMIIIKQIPVEQMTKEERQAALNEVKVLSMLSHPNIIQYYENFLEDKALMIVMEYAQGYLLKSYSDFLSFTLTLPQMYWFFPCFFNFFIWYSLCINMLIYCFFRGCSVCINMLICCFLRW